MSRKIRDFVVRQDKFLDVNEIKLAESLVERNSELRKSRHVKIKTKGNKRIYLNVISESQQNPNSVNMDPSLMDKLSIHENEKVEISICGIMDNAIQKLTLSNVVKAFLIATAALAILLVILGLAEK